MRDETLNANARIISADDGFQADPNIFGLYLEDCSPRIKMAVLRLMTDFRNNVTIENLAKELNVHPSHLEREYKKYCHSITLRQLLIGFRLHYATFLMPRRELKLNDIAEMAGFSSARDFYRSFQKHLGITAAQFKKSRRFENFKSIYTKTRMSHDKRVLSKRIT
jgi:transcriptional regulator GlxA family with amidase domain